MGKKPKVRCTGQLNDDAESLDVPCGTCIGCRQTAAKHWALRCFLELEEHASATAATLTYRPEKRPVTLSKRHVQLFMKRLRKAHAKKQRESGSKAIKPIRFFLSGEYGEQTDHPHYHAILYGMHTVEDAKTIQEAWAQGHVHLDSADHAAIAYIAGYAAKKYGDNTVHKAEERVDPETGEVYEYQPPFLQMSQGIARNARKKHRNSFRKFVVINGQKMSVPRYLHEHWKKTATMKEKDKLEDEKYEMRKQIVRTPEQREVEYLLKQAQIKLQRERRTKI